MLQIRQSENLKTTQQLADTDKNTGHPQTQPAPQAKLQVHRKLLLFSIKLFYHLHRHNSKQMNYSLHSSRSQCNSELS